MADILDLKVSIDTLIAAIEEDYETQKQVIHLMKKGEQHGESEGQ